MKGRITLPKKISPCPGPELLMCAAYWLEIFRRSQSIFLSPLAWFKR